MSKKNEIKVNDYLTPGVFIDYFLDNDNYKEIKLSIFRFRKNLQSIHL